MDERYLVVKQAGCRDVIISMDRIIGWSPWQRTYNPCYTRYHRIWKIAKDAKIPCKLQLTIENMLMKIQGSGSMQEVVGVRFKSR